MRIALVTNGITPYVMGGMQRHSFHLARTLSSLGVGVDLYHSDGGSGAAICELEGMTDAERSNIHSIFIPTPKKEKGNLPGSYLREMAAYSQLAYKAFRERPRVDFVYAKGLCGGAWLEAKAKGVPLPPVGIKAHGYEMYQAPPTWWVGLQHLMMRPAFRRQAQLADVVFSYGGKITDILVDKIGLSPTKIIEIPSGVSSDWIVESPQLAEKPIRFVFMGRYQRRKGIEELHSVIQDHPEWASNARFRFIGPIPADRQLQGDHIEYLGGISDSLLLRSALKNNDVLICPSFSEGMPNVILEAMANGLAIIATDVGAISTLVQQGLHGVLVRPGDTDQLAQAIVEFAEMPLDELNEKKLCALQTVRDSFTWESVGRKTIDEIESFLRKQPS